MKIRVVCGPTAGGKSALAMRLAAKHRIAIISADSRQVYRSFDIGTAKPDQEDLRRVSHYGIDIIDPLERYSAARWAGDAKGWIADSVERGLTPVVVGGTGLYIRALFEPLSAVPKLDAARREELEELLAAVSTTELRRWCQKLDPARAHLGKTQLIRAIETALLAGTRISESHARAQAVKNENILVPSYLYVDPEAALHSRIENRVQEMLRRGWLEEAAALAGSFPDDAPAWKASGYSVLRGVARGETDLATARARVIIETRQYAKRQRTWFRNQLPPGRVTRVDPESPGGDLLVQQWWEEGNEPR